MQHDFNIGANLNGPAFRADLNNALAAALSQSSADTEPPVTKAFMFWADTANNLLKIRNAGNTGWITLGDLSAANLGLALSAHTHTKAQVGLGNVPNYGASSSVGSNSASILATTKMVQDKAALSAQEFGATDNQIGVNQAWQNVKSSRALGTTYTNDTGRPIMVMVNSIADITHATPYSRLRVAINNYGLFAAPSGNTPSSHSSELFFIVPNDTTYMVYADDTATLLQQWVELR
jgi:hypothetical protein